MLRITFIGKYGAILKPEYFEQKDEHDVVQYLTDYWISYKRPPDEDDLIELVGRQYIDLIHSIYLGNKEWDLAFAEDRVIQFCKEQEAKIAVLESLESINQGDLAAVHERLKQAMTIGQDIGDTGLDIKRDVAKWLSAIRSERVPTGMIHLDIAMDGGLAAGELGIFLSPPNYGKSMALINVGFGAAGPISKCNVVHFSLEMNADTVAKRYGARTVFRFPKRSGDPDYEKLYTKYANIVMPGDVRAFRVSGAVDVIRSATTRLIDGGFVPGLIIVDHGDEVQPTRTRASHWIEVGDTFRALRELGHEFGCPVWTATQTRRDALNKEIITMADLAESFQKAGIADAIIAICQTIKEEMDDRCRLFVAKLRDGESRSMIQAKYYKKQQAIITLGFVSINREE